MHFKLATCKTMKLTTPPTEIATKTRKSWDTLWETFGDKGFHPLEARGVLLALVCKTRGEAEAVLQALVDREHAIAH